MVQPRNYREPNLLELLDLYPNIIAAMPCDLATNTEATVNPNLHPNGATPTAQLPDRHNVHNVKQTDVILKTRLSVHVKCCQTKSTI